jgi:catalase
LKTAEPTFEVSGIVARQPYIHPNSDFVQPGDLYRKVMTDLDREHLIGNIVNHLDNASKEIQLRQARIFSKADPEYGQQVAEGLGITL